MGPYQELPIRIIVDIEVIAMKGYFTLLRSPELEPHLDALSAGAAEYINCISVSPNECPIYDTKQPDGEAPVMLEFWGMWSTLLLLWLPGPLWLGVVASDRVISMCQIELNCVLTLKWIVWNRTAFRFKCV